MVSAPDLPSFEEGTGKPVKRIALADKKKKIRKNCSHEQVPSLTSLSLRSSLAHRTGFPLSEQDDLSKYNRQNTKFWRVHADFVPFPHPSLCLGIGQGYNNSLRSK